MSTELRKSVPNDIFELKSFADLERFANICAKSDFVPKDYKDKPGNIIVAVQWGSEIGLKPLAAMQSIAVINGRPILWGDAVLALIQSQPDCDDVTETMTGTIKGGDAICTCSITRKGKNVVRTFSVKQAIVAGLLSKQGPWTTMPERMLQLKARNFCVRDIYADVLKGIQPQGNEYDDIDEKDISVPVENPSKGMAGLKVKVTQTENAESLNKVFDDDVKVTEAEFVDKQTGEITPPADGSKDNPYTLSQLLAKFETAMTPSELIDLSDVARSSKFNEDETKQLREAYKTAQKRQAESTPA